MTAKRSGRPTELVLGGYGVVAVAKALEEPRGLVLVEPKDALMHNFPAHSDDLGPRP
jgi:hypothetical protein